MYWWVLGTVLCFLVLRFMWRNYNHPSHVLGRQAANMNWVATGRVKDIDGSKNLMVSRNGMEAIISFRNGNVILAKPRHLTPFKDFLEIERWLVTTQKPPAEDKEITYYEAINNYITSKDFYEPLLELQGTDQEYCIASMKMHKAGYLAGQSEEMVGALTMDSVKQYQKHRELAILFLQEIEKQFLDKRLDNPTQNIKEKPKSVLGAVDESTAPRNLEHFKKVMANHQHANELKKQVEYVSKSLHEKLIGWTSLPDLPQTKAMNADLQKGWQPICVAYSFALVSLAQYKTNPVFFDGDDFKLFFGNTAKFMANLYEEEEVALDPEVKLDKQHLMTYAGNELREGRRAVSECIGAIAKGDTVPHAALIAFFLGKVGITGDLKNGLSEKLCVFTRNALQELMSGTDVA